MAQAKSSEERRFTYGDYLTWPDDQRWELIDGRPFDMTPAPGRQHQSILSALAAQMAPFFQEKPCQLFFAPFDVRLPRGKEADEKIRTVVQPDLIVVCDEKKLDERGCRGAPDLAVEILSHSTSSRDSITKKALYEKHGVREYWVVSPNDRLVTVYRLEPDGEFGKSLIFGDADRIESPLFPGFTLDLARVFPKIVRVVGEPPPRYL